MAKSKGRELLLKRGDGADPEVFTTICGMQSMDLGTTNGVIDTTTIDCTDPGGKVETTSMYGKQGHSFSGDGLAEDTAAFKAMVADFEAQTDRNYEVVVPGDGTYTGMFRCTSFNRTGETEGALSFSASFESSGPVTFA